MVRWWIPAVLAVTLAGPLCAQRETVPGSEWDDYVRLLEIDGHASHLPLVFRSLSSSRFLQTTDSGPWDAGVAAGHPLEAGSALGTRVMPLEARVVFNSRFPWGVNDGALWAGRGLSLAASGGVAATWRGISAWALPTLLTGQNHAFDLVPVTAPGLSSYAYPWNVGRIDWPQRFGDRARASWDWGQSGIRADWRSLTLGVSTENLAWGPAVLNPIVMSANAPGFPHLDLGSGYPVRTPVGHVEARLVWGRLSESEYFDTVTTNDHRLFTGFTFGIAPRWLSGLTLGLTRVLYTTWDDSLRFADFVDVFQPFFKDRFRTASNPGGDDSRDQLLSLTARWVFPLSGFEAYVEWARNDHSANLRDFLVEPSHSQAFTLGFQKTQASGAGRARLRGEFTALGLSKTFLVRPTPSYYTHHIVTQGYTERGQIIGAGIGPGSGSQYLGFDRYGARGRWGLNVQRVSYNDDAYYAQFGAVRRREGHNVHLTAGVSALRTRNRVSLGLSLALTRELNRHYVIGYDVTNVNASVTVGWRPAR